MISIAMQSPSKDSVDPINETKQDGGIWQPQAGTTVDIEQQTDSIPRSILRKSKTSIQKHSHMLAGSTDKRSCYWCEVYRCGQRMMSPFSSICHNDTIGQSLQLFKSWKTTMPFVLFFTSCCLLQYSKIVAILFLLFSLGLDNHLDSDTSIENDVRDTHVCRNCGCCQSFSTRRVRFGNGTRFTKSRKPRRLRKPKATMGDSFAASPAPPSTPPPSLRRLTKPTNLSIQIPTFRQSNNHSQDQQSIVTYSPTLNDNEDILGATKVLLEDLTTLSDRWKKILAKKRKKQSRQQMVASPLAAHQAAVTDNEAKKETPEKKDLNSAVVLSPNVTETVDSDDDKFAEALVTNLDRLRSALLDFEEHDDNTNNDTSASRCMDDKDALKQSYSYSPMSSPSSSSPRAAFTRARLERLKLVVEQLQPKNDSSKGDSTYSDSSYQSPIANKTISRHSTVMSVENQESASNFSCAPVEAFTSPITEPRSPRHQDPLDLPTPRGQNRNFFEEEKQSEMFTKEGPVVDLSASIPLHGKIESLPNYGSPLIQPNGTPFDLCKNDLGKVNTNENEPDHTLSNYGHRALSKLRKTPEKLPKLKHSNTANYSPLMDVPVQWQK